MPDGANGDSRMSLHVRSLADCEALNKGVLSYERIVGRHFQSSADRLRAMAKLEHPGAGLEEKRAEEEEVGAGYERDVDIVPPAD